MFKDLMLNINNIETAINNYFKERYLNYTVTINEKKLRKTILFMMLTLMEDIYFYLYS